MVGSERLVIVIGEELELGFLILCFWFSYRSLHYPLKASSFLWFISFFWVLVVDPRDVSV